MVNLAIRPVRAAAPVRRPRVAVRTGLVVAAFCLVVAGPNLPTALLPAYRASYRMTPFGLSLVFSAYLAFLVPVLLLCARPALRARAATLLPLGLVTGLIADLLMAGSSSVGMLVTGRALSGVSVALSTGASAALMVSLVGERGRGSVATGNIAGALLGTGAAVVLAQLGIGPVIYLGHAAVTAAVTIALVVALAAGRAPGTTTSALPGRVDPLRWSAPSPVSAAATRSVSRRHVVLGFAVGAVGWAIPGLVTGLVPALLRDLTGPTAVVIATVPAMLLLGSAWGLQVLARRPALRWLTGYELTVGTALAGVGLALLAAGAWTGSVPLVYLGCVVAAGGPALGYRGGMVLLTRSLDPARQGATTSRYAASSYGFSAVVVVGAGAWGATGGMATAVTVGAGLLALVAVALLMCILVGESPRTARPTPRRSPMVAGQTPGGMPAAIRSSSG